MTDSNPAGPVFKTTYRGVSAAVFARTHVRDDGEPYTVFNTVLERRYREGDEWRSTSSFNEDQLAVAADLATEARTFIRGKQCELREQGHDDSPADA